jgi:hypothetical protein
MYRFRSGKFAGRTVEHVILRSAPRLYAMMRWAKAELRNKPHLRPLVEECSRLQVTFQNAQISARCANQGCRRRTRWMTFLTDWAEQYLRLGPRYWCDKHGPPRGEEDDDESQKIPITFDALGDWKDKRSERAVHRGLLEAFGISKKPSQITEKFAHRFFESLRIVGLDGGNK